MAVNKFMQASRIATEQAQVQAKMAERMAAEAIEQKNRGDEFELRLKECMERE